VPSPHRGRPTILEQQIRFPTPSRPSILAGVALAVLVLFFLREAVFEGRVFYTRDLHLQWYGQVETFVHCIMAGSWPLWDPYVSFGQPLLANANNQILYPPTWLHLLMRPWTYYTLFLGGHLLFSGVGVLRLGDRFRLSRGGALLAAALWIASGPFLSLGNAWNHLAAAAWIPWVLVAAEVAVAKRGILFVVAWAVAWALQIVCGSPDVVVMTGALVAACLARHLDWRRLASTDNRRVVWVPLAAGAMALALSAGQILPSLELASRSARRHLGGAERLYWSLHPACLLQTIVPVSWYDVPLNDYWRTALFEGREPFLFSVYLGIPMIALGLLAVARSREPLHWLLLATAVASTLVALGHYAPFYGMAVAVLPLLKVLRFPSKGLVLAAFCLAVLSGAGFDAWREPEGRRRTWATSIPLVVGLVALAGLAFMARFHADSWGPSFLVAPSPTLSYSAMLATLARKLAWGAAVILFLVLLLHARAVGSRAARRSAVLVALLAVSDLAWNHRHLNRTASERLFTLKPEAVTAIDQRDLSRLYVYDYSMTPDRSRRHLKRDTPYQTYGFRRDTPFEWGEALALRMYLLPPVGAAWRIFGSYERDNLGIQPVPLARLNALLAGADGSPLQLRLLQLGGVSQVLALHTAGFDGLERARTLPAPFLEPIQLFRVPAPLPRSYMVGSSRVAEGQAALDTLVDPSFDIRREILLSSGSPRRSSAAFRGSSRIVEMEADRVRIQSDSTEPGYVVLLDAYDPGWRTSVDGREAPLLRANLAFRAVGVTAGHHDVELVYRPRSVLLGLGVSGASALAMGLILMLARSRRPSHA
jgi:Bacterial membrane protein YfhO